MMISSGYYKFLSNHHLIGVSIDLNFMGIFFNPSLHVGVYEAVLAFQLHHLHSLLSYFPDGSENRNSHGMFNHFLKHFVGVGIFLLTLENIFIIFARI